VRILWVKAGKLLPADTGGKIRSYNILKHLARSHAVTLLSYYGGRGDSAYESALQKEFRGARTVLTRAPDSTGLAHSAVYVRHLFQPVPFAVSKFTHRRVRQAVSQALASGQFDIAVCDFLAPSLNFPPFLPVPTVLFQHNVETALWQRRADIESNLLKRMAYKLEAARMDRLERYALRRFHHVIAVSEHDRQLLLQMNPDCAVTVVPTGVDTQKYSIAPPAQADPPKIVFTGSMDWEPNIDAVSYFCRQILPLVRAQCPTAVFQIVGRTPHRKIKRLASESVQVTGTVPSVTDYLRDATLVVVPLRVAGGTRLKIFEAMAMGKAVVSTSIGAEGLEVESGRDLILADCPEAFANAILQLAHDASLRRRFEEAGAKLAAQFDWSLIAEKFAAVLEEVVRTFNASQQTTSPEERPHEGGVDG
jgi:glycosyltransferase involved in cell wall biosynthesis